MHNPNQSFVIDNNRSSLLESIREFWKYRELLIFLTWRDVKVRYMQTVLGIAWAIIQPVLMMIVFTVVFGRMANVPHGDVPYPVFVFAGLLPWTFFSSSITNAANSVVRNERLITKVYFPRLIIPIAAIGPALVDLFVSFVVLAGLMIYYEVTPASTVWLVPILVLFTAVTSIGVGLLLSALNVAYRDFRYAITYLIQLWLFATPTVYMEFMAEPEILNTTAEVESMDSPINTALSPALRTALQANPMTGLIAGFRSVLIGSPVPLNVVIGSCVYAMALLVFGVIVFKRMESRFADII